MRTAILSKTLLGFMLSRLFGFSAWGGAPSGLASVAMAVSTRSLHIHYTLLDNRHSGKRLISIDTDRRPEFYS